MKHPYQSAISRLWKMNTFIIDLRPADTDVFKTSSGRLKKVTTSYDQTRRLHDVWQKTSDLQRLEDLGFTSSWNVQFITPWRRLIYDLLKTSDLRPHEDVGFTWSWRCLIYSVLKMSDLQRLEGVCKMTSVEQRRSDVYTTSKGINFSYLVLSEIFRKFKVFSLG